MLDTALAVCAAAWGLVMALSPLLQIRRMACQQSSRDISIGYWCVLLVGFALWVAYGGGRCQPGPDRPERCRLLRRMPDHRRGGAIPAPLARAFWSSLRTGQRPPDTPLGCGMAARCADLLRAGPASRENSGPDPLLPCHPHPFTRPSTALPGIASALLKKVAGRDAAM
jgi:hypothetical protein